MPHVVAPAAPVDGEKPVAELTRRQFLTAGLAAAAVLGRSTPGMASELLSAPAYHSFKPGAIWLDTDGKPIQAHGGSIIEVDGKYYWYGENKEFTTGKTDIWTWGVRCYESDDLYNWRDLGLIIPPDTKDPNSPLNPVALLDRPHILFNRDTRKFVCWVKLMSTGSRQTRTVLVADRITGPYTIVRHELRPLGMNAGDFDLVVSPADGKAYMYFERVHSEMICADLTSDYLDFTGYYSTHFPHPGPPSVREGPAHFFRQGKHYLVTSGTTGYYPNPSEIAIAETFHGPWKVLGDLHPNDRSRTSFNSQISCIFRHPRKEDLFIAMADRWVGPLAGDEFESGKMSANVQSGYQKSFADPPQKLTEPEKRLMDKGLSFNTSEARYVWLPIRFKGEWPQIEWRSDWQLDEFK